MSCRFSAPELVLPRRPTADEVFPTRTWLRAMPLPSALAGFAAMTFAAASVLAAPWLAIVASALAAVPWRLRRSLRRVRADQPLVAALLRGGRAHVLELRASPSGWRPAVLDARVLSRRGLAGEERAIGWLVPHRGGFAFLPLAALVGSPRGVADPGRMPEGYFVLLERLARSPRLATFSDGELAEIFGMRLRAPRTAPLRLAA